MKTAFKELRRNGLENRTYLTVIYLLFIAFMGHQFFTDFEGDGLYALEEYKKVAGEMGSFFLVSTLFIAYEYNSLTAVRYKSRRTILQYHLLKILLPAVLISITSVFLFMVAGYGQGFFYGHYASAAIFGLMLAVQSVLSLSAIGLVSCLFNVWARNEFLGTIFALLFFTFNSYRTSILTRIVGLFTYNYHQVYLSKFLLLPGGAMAYGVMKSGGLLLAMGLFVFLVNLRVKKLEFFD
ncbi:MAG: hypothetical protein SOW18_05915 [Peptoniphilus sp.]|nr:hypothetical protein [Peptoniphilus sp.]MDY3119053.1 hypothetical protein [Peptoniphilus sp.]